MNTAIKSGCTGRSHFTPRLHSWKTLHKLKLCRSNMKFSFKTVYFLGVRGLTTSLYIVYNYITSGHTEL